MKSTVAILALALPIYAQDGFGRPTILRNVGIDQRLGASIPLDLEFTNEDGRVIPLRRFTGKPLLLARC